jgi:hypothetical protein
MTDRQYAAFALNHHIAHISRCWGDQRYARPAVLLDLIANEFCPGPGLTEPSTG